MMRQQDLEQAFRWFTNESLLSLDGIVPGLFATGIHFTGSPRRGAADATAVRQDGRPYFG
jgi:hypothetical protein